MLVHEFICLYVLEQFQPLTAGEVAGDVDGWLKQDVSVQLIVAKLVSLQKRGYASRSPLGFWTITNKGRKVLAG